MNVQEIVAHHDARSPFVAIKRTARQLLRNSHLLEAIWPALSEANAAQTFAVAEHYREFYKPFVNVSALMIVARFKRKAEYHLRENHRVTES